MRLLGENPRRRTRAIGFDGHSQAVALQIFAGQLRQALVILDDQNLPRFLFHTHSPSHSGKRRKHRRHSRG